jgi:Ni,Fe-hydrogenase maturation factor
MGGSERTFMVGCGNELWSQWACIDDNDDYAAYCDAAEYGDNNGNVVFAQVEDEEKGGTSLRQSLSS